MNEPSAVRRVALNWRGKRRAIKFPGVARTNCFTNTVRVRCAVMQIMKFRSARRMIWRGARNRAGTPHSTEDRRISAHFVRRELLFLKRRRLDNAGPPSFTLQPHQDDLRGWLNSTNTCRSRVSFGFKDIQLDFVYERQSDRDFNLEYSRETTIATISPKRWRPRAKRVTITRSSCFTARTRNSSTVRRRAGRLIMERSPGISPH